MTRRATLRCRSLVNGGRVVAGCSEVLGAAGGPQRVRRRGARLRRRRNPHYRRNAGKLGAPVDLFTENFDNGTAGQPVSPDAYIGAAPTDETYTADPAWLAAGNCNGLIVSEQDPAAQPAGIACNGFWPDVLLFGAAFGTWEGTDASTNHALVGYTDGSPGADKVELQTNTPIALPSANRFLIVRSDAAAQNCGGSVGNDAAVDDIELLDATPQLDLSATAGSIPVGESADLTFTITNTSELDAQPSAAVRGRPLCQPSRTIQVLPGVSCMGAPFARV